MFRQYLQQKRLFSENFHHSEQTFGEVKITLGDKQITAASCEQSQHLVCSIRNDNETSLDEFCID